MDSAWALEVMRKAPYITVSFTRPDGTAYGVPLSLASADGRIWYFHCAPEGDKLDALAVHPEVCLSAVTKCAPTVPAVDRCRNHRRIIGVRSKNLCCLLEYLLDLICLFKKCVLTSADLLLLVLHQKIYIKAISLI